MENILTKEQLESFATCVTRSNYLTFSKLLGVRDTTVYRRVIDLLYDRRISLADVEALPIVDDVSVRSLVESNSIVTNPSIVAGGTSVSGFSARSYLDGSSTGNTALIDLLRARNELENQGVPGRIVLNPVVVSVDPTVPLSYTSVEEVRQHYLSSVLPKVKADAGLTTEDLSALLPAPESLFPSGTWAPTLRMIYSDVLYSWMSPFITDSQAFVAVVDVDDDFSVLSLLPTDVHGILNFSRLPASIKGLHARASFSVAANGRAFNTSEIEDLRLGIQTAAYRASFASEVVAAALFDCRLVEVASAHNSAPSGTDGLVEGLAEVSSRIESVAALYRSLEKHCRSELRTLRI